MRIEDDHREVQENMQKREENLIYTQEELEVLDQESEGSRSQRGCAQDAEQRWSAIY